MKTIRNAMSKAIGPERLNSVERYMQSVCKICRIRPIHRKKLCYHCFKEEEKNAKPTEHLEHD